MKKNAQPEINISETDPGEEPLESVVVKLTADISCRFEKKDTRANMIELVKAARDIPLVYQAVILAEIDAIDERFNLLQVHFHRSGHGAGGNGHWTVKEI